MPDILPAPETSWVLAPLAARRSLAAAGVLPAMLATGPLELAGAWRARSRPASRGGVPGPLQFTARPGRVVLARHASGAWSVHVAAEDGRRFTVSAPSLTRPGTRRGAPVALDLFVLRAAARATLPRAARALEAWLWKGSGRRPGLVEVTRAGLRAGRLAPAPAPARRQAGRRLLLLHGTLSSTEHAFQALASMPGADRFWRFTDERYPGGVFGFNHFTLGEDPLGNARALRGALGPGPLDAVSHSRGGLVLRALVEALPDGPGLDLGRAVLAAAPNEGSPLAAPGRRTDLVALLLNLAEELTPAALGLGLPFAATALAWLARGVAVALPGLAAMQPEGLFLHALNGPPAPPEGAYVALCAHARLEGGRLARYVDAGLGALFTQPHDLVVPTAGGWSVDGFRHRAEPVTGPLGAPSRRPAIGADRIACFGPGGNLPGGAHHFNLFARAETADVLVRALAGEALGLAPIDPQAPLAPRASRHKAAAVVGSASRQTPGARRTGAAGRTALPSARSREALLDLFVIGSEAGAADALLLACYRGARVLEPFARRGARWQRIVAGHRRLRSAALGEAEPPSPEALRALGVDLFEALLPGDARRLYDEARGAEAQLELRITSTLDWVADAPWELAFDPRRGNALAADAHLARDVYSAIPAERPQRTRGPLRVLVVTASPRELPALSLLAEQRALTAALASAALAGRVSVEVLARATPEALAERLDAARWDVVHFVGHGEHDVRGGQPGRLVFEDGRGGVRLLDASAVRMLLAGRGLSLVFVNACESGLHGRGDLARGVAPELARAGVPAVVAHQLSVLDASALRFARGFYESLARGRGLPAAAAEARQALRLADHGVGYDWATPVVFLRT